MDSRVHVDFPKWQREALKELLKTKEPLALTIPRYHGRSLYENAVRDTLAILREGKPATEGGKHG
jgi:hypothetical protein